MLQISKHEAFAMRKIVGEKYVKMSHTKSPKYYIVENFRNLNELDKFRKSHLAQ